MTYLFGNCNFPRLVLTHAVSAFLTGDLCQGGGEEEEGEEGEQEQHSGPAGAAGLGLICHSMH